MIDLEKITIEDFFKSVIAGDIRSKTSPTAAKNILNILSKDEHKDKLDKANISIKSSTMGEFNQRSVMAVLVDVFSEEKKEPRIPILTENIAKRLRGEKGNWKEIVGKRYIPSPAEMLRITGAGTLASPIAPARLNSYYILIRQLIDTSLHEAGVKLVNQLQEFERNAESTKGLWGSFGFDHPTRGIDYTRVRAADLVTAMDRLLTSLPSMTFEERSTKNYAKLKENSGIRHGGQSAELGNITYGRDPQFPTTGAYFDPVRRIFDNVGAKTGSQQALPLNGSGLVAVMEQIANREKQLGRPLEIGDKLFDLNKISAPSMEGIINAKYTQIVNTMEHLTVDGKIEEGLDILEWDAEKYEWVKRKNHTLKEFRSNLSTAVRGIKDIGTDRERKEIADLILAHKKPSTVLGRNYTKGTVFDETTPELDGLRKAVYLVDWHKANTIYMHDENGKLILTSDGKPALKYINPDTKEIDLVTMLSSQSTYDQSSKNVPFSIADELAKEESIFAQIPVTDIDNSTQQGADLRKYAQQAGIPFQPDVEELEKPAFVRNHILSILDELKKTKTPDGKLAYPELKEWDTLDTQLKEAYIGRFVSRFGKNTETLKKFKDTIIAGTNKDLLLSGDKIKQIFNIHTIIMNGLAHSGEAAAVNDRKKILKTEGITSTQLMKLGLEQRDTETSLIKPPKQTLDNRFREANGILADTGMSFEDRLKAKKSGTMLELASEINPEFSETVKDYDPETVKSYLHTKYSKAVLKGTLGILAGKKALTTAAATLFAPEAKALEVMFELGTEAVMPSPTGPKEPETPEEKVSEMLEMAKGQSTLGFETSSKIKEVVEDVEDQVNLEEREQIHLDKKVKLRGDLGEQVGLMFQQYLRTPSKVEDMTKKDLKILKTKIKNIKQNPDKRFEATKEDLERQVLRNQMDVQTGVYSEEDFIDTFPSGEGLGGQRGFIESDPKSARYWTSRQRLIN